MALVPHKVTALAESDAQGTDGKNIVAGAVVSLYDTSGEAAILYDDENGANGSTAKQTDATGQVVVYVTAGEYNEEVNGSIRRRVAIGGNGVVSYGTTAELEATRPNKTGQRAESRERANAQYRLAAEGYTALAGDIVAANGRVWELILGSENPIDWWGNTESGFSDALERLNSTSKTLTLNDQSPLILSGSTRHTIEKMTVKGSDSFTLGNYTKGGVIHVTGAGLSPLYLGAGANIDGCTFYYPNQSLTSSPIAYPFLITLKNESPGVQAINIDIRRNVFVNVYDCIDTNGTPGVSAPAFVSIRRNRGCAINTFINHPYTLTECMFDFNEISYAWWTESIGQDVRQYINANSNGIIIGDCDGTTCTSNFFFGMRAGFKFESTSAITSLSNNVSDGCRHGFDFSDATQIGNCSISGGGVHAKSPINPFTECAAIYGNFSDTVSAQILVKGVEFGAAHGRHVDINQASGTCFMRLVLDGNFFNVGTNDPDNNYEFIRIRDASNNAKVHIRGLFEQTISSTGTRTGIDVSGCEIVDIDGVFENLDTGVIVASASPNSRYRVGGIFKSVASELDASGTLTGQVLVTSIFSSEAPALQINVASAATLLIPNNTSEFFVVSGTTSITDIDGKREGRRITLKFNGSLTVTDGGNLALNGNFVTTGNDTLTLVCDGSTWYEVARSAN